MVKNIAAIVIIGILLSSVLVFPASSDKIEALSGATLYVDDDGTADYTSIQDAIIDASNGDTIFVYNGTYYENYIIIDKEINLLGENKKSTIIDAKGAYKCIQIYSDNVLLSGFTLRNVTPIYDIWYNSLIEINLSENVTLENNILFNKSVKFPNLQNSGICILDSKNCILKNNSMFNCSILLWGLETRGELDNYIHDIDESNTVNLKSVYYYKDCDNITVPTDAGQVYLVSCNNSKVSNLNISNASYCIHICYSNYNIIKNNTIDNCVIGIMFDHSNYNKIINNKVRDVFCGGIFFDFSEYNIIENNDISVHFGCTAFEMFSDYNIVKYNNMYSDGSCILFDDSDYNNVNYNNICGSFSSARMWGDSRHTKWNNNFWTYNFISNRLIYKRLPKAIIGMHHSLYDSVLDEPKKLTFPSYVRFDRNPAKEPFKI